MRKLLLLAPLALLISGCGGTSGGTNDPNQANVQPYVQGLDATCNLTTERVRIGNNNGNDGAPWAQALDGKSETKHSGRTASRTPSRAASPNSRTAFSTLACASVTACCC